MHAIATGMRPPLLKEVSQEIYATSKKFLEGVALPFLWFSESLRSFVPAIQECEEISAFAPSCTSASIAALPIPASAFSAGPVVCGNMVVEEWPSKREGP